MWKKLLAKLAQNKFYQKAVLWLKESGFTNIFYLAIVGGIWFVPLGPLAGLKSEIATGAGCIFAYINWNLIKKLWKAKIGDKIDDVVDKLEDKL